MHDEVKENVKTAFLMHLIEESPLIWRGTAFCLSAIAKIELPQGKWTDIIQNLSSNSTHENLTVRKAALMTLSNICEELREDDNVECLNVDNKGFILSSFVNNLSDARIDNEVREICINGILQLISAAEAIF